MWDIVVYSERPPEKRAMVCTGMLWGEYSHQLDKKGRLIIPARHRPYLTEGAVLTRGIDRHLVVYPQEIWHTITQQINQIPITEPTGRALRRLLFSGAVELSLDRQGRVLIPSYLRDYASLESEVLIIGMETFVEIWQPEGWRQTLDRVSSTLSETGLMLQFNL
jgi:MraZ protein